MAWRPTCIVLHDSVTRSTASTLRVLRARGLSTHYLVDESGMVSADHPTTGKAAHAGSAWNSRSIGIDIVSLYDPRLLDARNRWGDEARRARVAPRRWAPKRGVITMTEPQRQALVDLVRRLCEEHGIPARVMAGGLHQDVDPTKFRGVVAHGQFCASRWDGMLGVEALRDAGFEEVAG